MENVKEEDEEEEDEEDHGCHGHEEEGDKTKEGEITLKTFPCSESNIVARSFRYMRRKPTIISYIPPEAEPNEPEKDLEANNNNNNNSLNTWGVCKCATFGQMNCPRCRNREVAEPMTEGARNRQKRQKKAERMNSVRLTKPLVVSVHKLLLCTSLIVTEPILINS